MQKKIKSGIAGLDEVLGGGIPEKSMIAVQGGPGTGKTILGLQFIFAGLVSGEAGVFATTDEYPSKVLGLMQNFGWKTENGLVVLDSFSSNFGKTSGNFVVQDLGDINEFFDVLVRAIRHVSAKRVVIDNFSSLCLGKPISPRNILLNLKRILQSMGCSSIILLSQEDRFAEILCDGLLKLSIDEKAEQFKRFISVIKMRGTPIKIGKYVFDIDDKGISIQT